MEPVRLGIVGCGVIGTHHLNLADRCALADIVAVADVVEERALAAAERFRIPTVYDNDDDLIHDDRVEAVVLAMPAGFRTPVAFKALQRNKHVLLEKPVARSAEEVEQIMALQGDRVVGCCSSRFVFTGHAEAATECIASGALGKIRTVRVRGVQEAPETPRAHPPAWRQSMEQNGGGVLVNVGIYDLDYMMHVTGWKLKPREVLARWWPAAEPMSANVAPGSDADAHCIGLILCDGEIVFSVERGEFCSVRTHNAWEIVGTEGALYVPVRPQKEIPDAVILDRFVPGEGVVRETVWKEGDGRVDDDILNDFVCAIREGRQPRTDLERSLVLQKMTDAIYASAKSGAAVSIS
jgi:predicted dehydrogenase